MSSRGSKKKTNLDTSTKNKKVLQDRKIWWELNKKKIIILAAVIAAIIGIITIASITSRGANNISFGGQYTLMDLGSTGCVPCDNLQPVLESLRSKYNGRINVNFYDVNKSTQGMQLANKYNVTSIPTLIYLDKNGRAVHTSVGYKSQSEIENEFRRLGWI